MYIMYSLVCCGTRKRIHNIDNCGLQFGCLVCCGTRKRIHNIDNCGLRFVCLLRCGTRKRIHSATLWHRPNVYA